MKKHFLFILMTVCCMILGARHLSAQDFCTLPIEYQGYTYNVFRAGGNCWMRENLRATQYADGSDIPDTRYYNDDPSNLDTYGRLYTYYAATRTNPALPITQFTDSVQGVCPEGWHVSTQREWESLESSTGVAGFESLLSADQWLRPIGTSPADGFNFLPGGYYNSSNSRYERLMASGYYWTTTLGSTYPLVAGCHCNCPQITIVNMLPSSGFNVRCVSYLKPDVTTSAVFDIGLDSAKCSGNVTFEGSSAVIARGICWNTSPNPTIENLHTTELPGSDPFIGSMNGLTSGTVYYVRAYATNDGGTSYGNQEIFTTLQLILPTVTTSAVTNITGTTATCGGNVTFDGNTSVTARGVCWSTSQNPTNSNNYTTDGSGTGAFTSNLTNLTAGTIYYVRAYATNSQGTSYGEQKIFVTGSNCPSTLTDRDGNTYNTVQIGSQCWMKENLRTTKKPNGTSITSGIWTPGSNSVATYGRLYSWTTVMNGASSSNATPSGVQGICPDGWHVPSDNEWKQMEMAVGMSQSDANLSGQYRGNIAAKLCGNTGWNSSAIANAAGNLNAPDRNSTGFSALPAGDYTGSYNGFGGNANFWSATESSSDSAYCRRLRYNSAGVNRYDDSKTYGYSVRCVRD